MNEAPEYPKESRFAKIRRRASVAMELRRERKALPAILQESRNGIIPEEVRNAYEEFRLEIENVFGAENLRDDLIHHGTGAKKYAGEKYGDGVTDELQYPLDNILTDGLEPQHDIFSLKGPMMSTSLAPSWEYAKWYAAMCQDPETPLKWEYGSRDHWGSFFLYRTLVDKGNIKHIPTITKRIGGRFTAKLFGQEREKQNGRALKWLSATTSSLPENAKIQDILKAKTDISGNFGGILTIRKEDAPRIEQGPGDAYEYRTSARITPDKFVALSVPIDQVDTYRNVIHALGHTFPVLPMEAVDLHMSQFSFRELTEKGRA